MKQLSAFVASRLHLEHAGEGYFQHLRFAVIVGLMLVGAGLACIIHALVPALCATTASQTVERLAGLFRDRSRIDQAVRESSGALTLVLLILLTVPIVSVIALKSSNVAFALPTAVLTSGVLVAYLWSNPALDPVE